MNEIPEPYATMVYVAIYTGVRVSEFAALKWNDVGFDAITTDERFCRGCCQKMIDLAARSHSGTYPPNQPLNVLDLGPALIGVIAQSGGSIIAQVAFSPSTSTSLYIPCVASGSRPSAALDGAFDSGAMNRTACRPRIVALPAHGGYLSRSGLKTSA